MQKSKKVPVVHKLCLGKLPVKRVQYHIFCTICIVIPFVDSLYLPYFSTVCVLRCYVSISICIRYSVVQPQD